MINFDDYINGNKTEHNKNWPYTPDHPYRILIIEGSGSGKTNALINLINEQNDIDKIYLYVWTNQSMSIWFKNVMMSE